MIVLLSPAKSLQLDCHFSTELQASIPEHIRKSEVLINKLKKSSVKQLKSLMNISDELAQLNKERYENWSASKHKTEGLPALHIFKGDVYRGLNAKEFSVQDLAFAKDHLRILSGLYGVLKPQDAVLPYRLEMGSRFPVAKAKNLYDYWSNEVSTSIRSELAKHANSTLINLASVEYFKVVDTAVLKTKWITLSFKEEKDGTFRSVMTYAKLARGRMAALIVKRQIEREEDIKALSFDGYRFNPKQSADSEWVFTRKSNPNKK